MRVVAGKYGSRRLESVPGQTTRPTSDKVKGAVFSSLGGSFEKGRILDCYSGTGNIALEALSRGMEEAVCVDQDHRAVKVIRANAMALGVLDQVQIIKANIFSALDQMKMPFDLVYIDPPYQKEQNVKLLEALDRLELVCDNGVVVVESLSSQSFPEQIGHFTKQREKTYRNTKITYYRKETRE